MDILAFLTGISPWWWIAAAILLFVVEMLTFTYFVIWIAAAAVAVGLIMFAVPDLSGVTQLAWFATLSIGLTVAGRYALAHLPRRERDTGGALNQRAARLVGRVGKATSTFDGGEGTVEIDQIVWRARLSEGLAADGTRLKVIDADGMTLICEVV